LRHILSEAGGGVNYEKTTHFGGMLS
jgi:hypothetical protein